MIKLGVVMDNIQGINYKKDSTLAMLWEAEARGYEIYYFEQANLFIRDGIPYGEARGLALSSNENKWAELTGSLTIPLMDLDIILMRKDPPFNQEYIYTTYILEHAEQRGVIVANSPQALRDANEKMFTTFFPQCCPPNLVTQSAEKLHAFWQEHGDIVCKPLDSMGGASVFRLQAGDVNANAIFELLTDNEKRYIMAQRFIPEIQYGDKRILMVGGSPVPYALARVPQGRDWRGNLAVGAKGRVQPLTEKDQWIADQVGPTLKERGLFFVGLDVIGDYLTEINVTSPTGIREIQAETDINIAAMLLDELERQL
ncbi:MAG: glutathione synthase [Gammaproteobacteria bacterium]